MMQHVDRLAEWLGLSGWQTVALKVALALLAAAIALWVIQRTVEYLRGLRAATINPKLAKYAGEDDPEAQNRRLLAGLIRSTASTDQIPGYKIVRAVEAMYVDGFRTPAEALEGLKAAAAEKGANALINVRHERSSMGRCAASGDAVVAETTGQAYSPPRDPIQILPAPKKTEGGKEKRGDGPMIR